MDSSPFLFLCRLAYAARFRIPIIIILLFVIFDIQVQVDINVETHEVPQVQPDAFEELPATDDDNLEGSFIPMVEFEPFSIDGEEREIADLEA